MPPLRQRDVVPIPVVTRAMIETCDQLERKFLRMTGDESLSHDLIHAVGQRDTMILGELALPGFLKRREASRRVEAKPPAA